MKRTFFSRVTLGFALALVILTFNTGILYRNTLRLIENNDTIAQTLEKLARITQLHNQIISAETGQRGYVITGDLEYLEPYATALNTMDQSLHELMIMTQDNTSQQQRLGLLEELVDTKLAELSGTIELRQREGFEAAQSVIQTNEGKQTMDDIRRLIDEMEEEERALLAQRARAVQASVPTTLIAFGAAAFLNILLLSTVYVLVRRDTAQRRKSEAALRETNQKLVNGLDELESRNRAITLLSQMAGVLQACMTTNEAYTVIAKFAERLFPAHPGTLYLLSESRNLVQEVAVWGNRQNNDACHVFAPNECWALRRGQLHQVQDPRSELLCTHVEALDQPAQPYICLPLLAQGEILGVLYLQARDDRPDYATQPSRHASLSEIQQQLAMAVAEQIALALANLRLRETLRNQSIRDPLTGLYNRRYLEETLERELLRAQRKATPLAVIMLDIDHFKHFNDTFGHEAGDIVLHAVGQLLKTNFRGSDLACRYGGEEFTLVLPETSRELARERAEELRTAAAALRVLHHSEPLGSITLSLGIAVFPQHGQDWQQLLRAADAALYQAKQQGRNRVVACEADMVNIVEEMSEAQQND